MPARRIQAFTGMMPKLGRRVLPPAGAQVASNCLLTSGNITPIFGPQQVTTFGGTSPVKSVYRMYSGGVDSWLAWTSDVDVARSPIAGDQTFRIYFTSDAFEPRVTNLAMATAGSPYPNSWYVLGVTPPVTAPTISSVSGGSGSTETRIYCYTFVTQWGEESAPSPVSASQSGYINGTWNLASMDAAPSNTYTISAVAWAGGVLTLTVNTTFGLRAGEYITLSGLAPASLNASFKVASASGTSVTIALTNNPGSITDGVGTATRDAPHNTSSMTKRIYRSVTTATDTEFFFVDEIAVASTTYGDSKTVLGGSLATLTYAMPPVDLRGIKTLPSGALVGFSKNIVCVSEPFLPYAWPVQYQQPTDYPVVGVDVFDQSVVVGTAGNPYVISGTDPASMSPQKLDKPWPCLAKRSMISLGVGVAYACPLGLAVVGDLGVDLITKEYYTFIEWATYNPSTFIAAQHDDRYYAGFTSGTTGGLWVFGQNINFTEPAVPSAVYSDPGTGYLYLVISNVLYQWMADIGTREPMDWMSAEFVERDPFNLGAAKIDADWSMTADQVAAAQANYTAVVNANAALIAANATKGSLNGYSLNGLALNGSLLSKLPPTTWQSLSFTLYEDNQAVFSTQVTDSNVFRLPAGNKYDNYAVRVSGNVPVEAIVVGPTPLSLKTV